MNEQPKSAFEFNSLFTSGQLSAQEIVAKSFDLISTKDGDLNAFLSVFHDRATKRAKELDAKRAANRPLGKLAGVPVAIKDLIHIKGEITSCASKFLKNYRALFDATVVQLLEEADALLIGKTNLDEFAMGGSGIHSAYGATRNPWNLSKCAGGSSSGSAAAVSGGLCPISLGTDTGGSVRLPAAFTGICGFKPTYGRVSRYGLVAFASSLDQIGPLARSVEEIALTMDVIGKPCRQDATSIHNPRSDYLETLRTPISKSRIGVPWKFLEELGPESRLHFEKGLEIFKEQGAEIVEVDLSTLQYGIAVYYVLASAEASSNLARFDGIRYGTRSPLAKSLEEVYDFSRQEGFGLEVKRRIFLGTYVLSSGFKDAYYQKAQKVRTLILNQLRSTFVRCDVIALPTAPGIALSLEKSANPVDEYLQDLYNVGANLAGLPAISVPNGLSQSGMPFGMQLMGPLLGDAKVLSFAHAFQSHCPLRRR